MKLLVTGGAGFIGSNFDCDFAFLIKPIRGGFLWKKANRKNPLF